MIFLNDILQFSNLCTDIIPVLQMLLTFVMIYQYLGIYSLAAAVAIVLFAPFSALMAKIESALQDKHMKKKDERIELLTELFNNIKVIYMGIMLLIKVAQHPVEEKTWTLR